MPIRHRGNEVNRIDHRGRNVINVSYPTDDAHTFADDGNSDALAPLTSGTFLFEHAMVTVTIDAAGNVSVSAVLAADTSVMITATTTADFTGSSPVNTATDRSVQVDLVVPTITPAFDNEGDTVTGVLTVAQTVDPLDTCNIGDWTPDGAPFNSGTVTFGACNAPTSASDTANPCNTTTTTSGTRTRTQPRSQNQVRTVTRVVNGLQDLTNPCDGVATSRTIASTSVVTNVACTRTATNTAYVSGTTTTQGTPTAQVETITNTGACGGGTEAGCCPDATCTATDGTRTITFDLSASTREDVTRRNCDNAIISTNTVTVTAASTGNTRQETCSYTYANPDTCSDFRTLTCSVTGYPSQSPLYGSFGSAFIQAIHTGSDNGQSATAFAFGGTNGNVAPASAFTFPAAGTNFAGGNCGDIQAADYAQNMNISQAGTGFATTGDTTGGSFTVGGACTP